MPRPQFFVTSQHLHAQAVRLGDRLELAGQGGWDETGDSFPESLPDEIAEAFRNVDRVLALAGAIWEDVVSVTSYHVDLGGKQDLVNSVMYDLFRTCTPDQTPPWTCVGVAALGNPKMRAEVRVSALAR